MANGTKDLNQQVEYLKNTEQDQSDTMLPNKNLHYLQDC